MRTEDIAAAVAKHFPKAGLQALVRLKGGVSAEVFRLDLCLADGSDQSIILRAMGKSGLDSAQEYALLSSLHAVGLPTPRPICLDNSRSHVDATYILMEFVDGSSEIPVDLAALRIVTMSEALTRIHEVPTASLPHLPLRLDPVPELLDFLSDHGKWGALHDCCASLGQTVYGGEPVLLHGDFWAQNLIWRDDRIVAILDWEDAARGDPLSDVACALLELRYMFDEALVNRFLATYSRHTSIDSHRLALWQLYVASAAQRYMGTWGLEPSREAHMRRTAHRQIREAAAIMGISLPR